MFRKKKTVIVESSESEAELLIGNEENSFETPVEKTKTIKNLNTLEKNRE